MIALALLTLSPGRMGGSEEVARTLTNALRDHGTLSYRVLAPPGALDVANGLPVVGGGARTSSPRTIAIARALMSGAALNAADVVHYPFTICVPRPRRPHVVTLHDVLHLDLPDLVSPRIRWFRKWAYDRASQNADRVIVPSDFVRARAIARLGLDPARVRVIHHAVDRSVFHPSVEAEREPFLLYPARPWPHKNHALLFDAFARVRRSRPGFTLLLTGGGHDRLALPDGVRSLGVVPRQELAGLYRRASALVFPSRYEGFGLPVLEAMASGLPVAAAAGGAVEEVANGVAVFFPPDSPDDAAAAILAAIDESTEFSQKGIERASRFTRRRLAAAHEAVYGELG